LFNQYLNIPSPKYGSEKGDPKLGSSSTWNTTAVAFSTWGATNLIEPLSTFNTAGTFGFTVESKTTGCRAL
jgi:hypothetical protein